jgi:hypothetical protein
MRSFYVTRLLEENTGKFGKRQNNCSPGRPPASARMRCIKKDAGPWGFGEALA